MMPTDPAPHATIPSAGTDPTFVRGESVLAVLGLPGSLDVSSRRLVPLLADLAALHGVDLWVQFYDSVLHGVPVPLRPEALPEVPKGDMGRNLRQCLTEALGASQTLPNGRALDRVIVGFDPFDAVVKPLRYGPRRYPGTIVVPSDADASMESIRRMNPDHALREEGELRSHLERTVLLRSLHEDRGEVPWPDARARARL